MEAINGYLSQSLVLWEAGDRLMRTYMCVLFNFALIKWNLTFSLLCKNVKNGTRFKGCTIYLLHSAVQMSETAVLPVLELKSHLYGFSICRCIAECFTVIILPY